MSLKVIKSEMLEKVKAEIGKPVSGYLMKVKPFTFQNGMGEMVSLSELRLQDTITKKLKRIYLSSHQEDVIEKLKLKCFTQIEKREVEANDGSGLRFKVTEVSQNDEDTI